MKNKLNILLINNYFPPEIGAASHLYFYLAKELVRRGHKVKVLTGIPRYNVDLSMYRSYLRMEKVYIEELEEGLEVIRVKLPYVDRKQLIRRGIEHFEISYKLFSYGKKFLGDVDVSLVYSPPLTLYWVAEKIRKMISSPYILNVQDLFPQEVIDLGLMKNKLLISIFRKIEKKAYESADLITVHSENNKYYVDNILGKNNKTFVFENWIDDQEIVPGEKNNEFSKRYNLENKFVVSFAGTLGLLQDIGVILKAANLLKNFQDIVFLIVGDGTRKIEAENLIENMKLKNVILLPPLPREKYPLVLHSSDISLVTLIKELKTPVVPSKILSIMSAGKPVVAAMNKDGDAPKLIENAKCGFAVDAGDAEGLAKAILQLYNSEELRKEFGKSGRKYVEEHLSAKKAAERYEKLFIRLIENKK